MIRVVPGTILAAVLAVSPAAAEKLTPQERIEIIADALVQRMATPPSS